ncbi:MAG: alpha amylase C-terminal domain-containing protein, partial [Bacillota bacterium]|nr:alpha amylase C-terminal domain-containing protein [Bacillota bacterium]
PNAVNQENTFGINFLKKLNTAVAQYDPTALMIAEDSTDWPQVTGPVESGGLGFGFKWNMGWMNDILKYMETLPSERSSRHNNVTFSILYAFSEKFILPFSHDEVVHGKKSLLNKMPGEYEDKFAQLRLLLGFMYTHPGKKLTFMGTELGQFSEWKDKEQLDWNLFEYGMHVKLNLFIIELNKLYKRSKPLFELDHRSEGFEWIDVNNHSQSIFSFIRKGVNPDELLVIICNFTEKNYSDYRVGVPLSASYREILNSDSRDFGGAGITNKKVVKAEEVPFHGRPFSLTMNIPSFGISILRPVKQRKGREQNEEETLRSHVAGRGKRKQA